MVDRACEFSDLDIGYCLVHMCYLSDDEHPHVWDHCYDDNCAECASYDDEGSAREGDNVD